MKQATFYIGADNETGKVDKAKIVELVSIYFAGSTIIPATGIWRGEVEESVVLIVGHDNTDDFLRVFARTLCEELGQYSVGLSDGTNFELITLKD